MSMMDTDIDMRLFESLVFEPDLNCEHGAHPMGRYGHSDEGGRYQVIGHNSECGCKKGEGETILCERFVKTARVTGILCLRCNRINDFDRRYTILEKIR